MMKKILFSGVILLLLSFLLINPAQAVDASRVGLLLWFESVLPVLLPFLILSRLLIRIDGLAPFIKFLNPILKKLLGLSPMGSYCLLLGFLCGYPMGAKLAADLVRDDQISKEEGTYLLQFCNNVSPAFLMGFCMTEQLKHPTLIPVTVLLVYGTPILLAILHKNKQSFPDLKRHGTHQQKQVSGFQISFKIVDTCIMDGLESILKLGCYIILFSIMARLVSLLPWSNLFLEGLCIGILEITNGIAAICQIPTDFTRRYLAVLGLIIFGGLSGVAQTHSMLQGSGLSTGIYILSKLKNAALALIFALIWFILQ